MQIGARGIILRRLAAPSDRPSLAASHGELAARDEEEEEEEAFSLSHLLILSAYVVGRNTLSLSLSFEADTDM